MERQGQDQSGRIKWRGVEERVTGEIQGGAIESEGH